MRDSVGQYLHEIGAVALLDAAKERELSQIIEKGREAGIHQLSGALLDPSTLKDLIPDFASRGAPLGTPVDNDNIYFLTRE